ncbi:MAG: hypothetical protein IAE82_02365 [Opitutaceae bacterium]|nr:hypothetical protein [Opitutaceae bacterium]
MNTITEEQGSRILALVFHRLHGKQSVRIDVEELIRVCGLPRPFYQGLIAWAHRTNPGFDFHAGWKSDEGEAAEVIEFKRPTGPH